MKVIRLFWIFFIALILSGCKSSEKDVKQFVEEVKKSPSPSIEPLPVLEQYILTKYNAYNLRDPFNLNQTQILVKNPIPTEKIKLQSQRPDHARPREFLESFSLDTLVMVGTIEKRGETWGLVVDKSGIIHRVKVGNYVGTNSGKITSVSEEGIFISELVADGQGGWMQREASLMIKR
jgi:type IV pilus assembly protein PilP